MIQVNTPKEVLNSCKVVAIVGLSPDQDRPSYKVASYLKEQGYRVIPVNPKVDEILNEHCYPNLTSIPESIDVVDIFRRSEDVPAIVEEAILIDAKAIWMQEGVVNDISAAKAMASGLLVVMDRCMKKEHQILK